MRLSKRIAGLEPFSYCGSDYVLRMDANESCVSFPQEIQKEIAAAVAKLDLTKYPDNTSARLCAAYAEAYDLEPECIVAGNGSDELIRMIIGGLLPDNASVVGVELDFGSYWSNCSIYGKKAIQISRNEDMGFCIDDLVAKAADSDADLVIFSNPSNPSGTVINREKIIGMAKKMDCLIVVDEAYMDFSDQSILDFAKECPNLIVLRTLSKAMGLAGARIGFAVSNPDLSHALKCVRDAYNISSLNQTAGTILLKNKKQMEYALTETRAVMSKMYDRLVEISGHSNRPIRVFPSNANYILIRLENAKQLLEYLHTKDISIRLVGFDMLRISCAPWGILSGVLDEIDSFLTGGK